MILSMIAFLAAPHAVVTENVGINKKDTDLISRICDLHASDVPVALRNARFTLRMSVYAPIELVGPPPCRQVKFFIQDSAAARRFERFMKERERRKEYVTYFPVLINGSAAFDRTIDAIKVEVHDIVFLSSLRRKKHMDLGKARLGH